MKIRYSKVSINRYIAIHPNICHGKPVFRGTRIPITTVLELLESGMAQEEILRGFPSLTRKAIQAALHYAILSIQKEEYLPFAKVG